MPTEPASARRRRSARPARPTRRPSPRSTSRRAGEAAMPPGVHTDDEVRSWLASRVVEDEVWVAESAGSVAAYARMTATWLDDLYVAPPFARQGIGSALLDLVKARRPDGFCLWVFETNVPARAFYARHGLVELERTDGAGNEEKVPRHPDGLGRGRAAGVLPRPDRRRRRPAGRPARPPRGPHPRGAGAQGGPGPAAARPRARARDRRPAGRRGRPSWARSGWPGSCTRIVTESLGANERRSAEPPSALGTVGAGCHDGLVARVG